MSWAANNVAQWMTNDESLYVLMKDCLRRRPTKDAAATSFVAQLADAGITQTPDGANYTVSAVRAAMVGE